MSTKAKKVDRLKITPGRAKYIFVYPFEKTRDWLSPDKSRTTGHDGPNTLKSVIDIPR